MKTLDIPVHDGAQFTWNKKTGFSEESTLGGPIAKRVYADACDVGFYVQSHKTNRKMLFTFLAEDKSVDGELLATKWQSADDPSINITVFND
jgi:hypothetical protein